MTCLLDINILIALFDSAHVDHNAAHRWFGGKLATFDANIPVWALVNLPADIVELIPKN